LNALAELVCKRTDLGGGASFAAIHADRQTDDKGVNLADFHEAGDALDGVAFALIDGFHRVGEDPKVIGRGDADAGVTVIDAERRVGRVGMLRVQRSSTGRISESFLMESA
jgi:hypothetical protein